MNKANQNFAGYDLRGPRTGQAGFSLVEVLVSIIILSFGVLGVVGLQAAALQSSRDSKNQAMGVQLAGEMADMIRGNRTVAAAISDNPYIGSSRSDGTGAVSFQATASGELVPANPEYCLSVGLGALSQCNDSTQVAKAQLTEWLARVSSTLPGAQVVICADADPYDAAGLAKWSCNPVPNAPIVIKIGWSRRALKAAPDGTATIELATSSQSTPSVMVAVVP